MYKFSEKLAWVAGVALPVGETLRRWGAWWDIPWAYLDDLFLGALFLIAAVRSRHGGPAGPRWLAAAFGAGCGMGYASWAATMSSLDHFDPSGVPGKTAAILKAAVLVLSIAGLACALNGPPTQSPQFENLTTSICDRAEPAASAAEPVPC